MLDNSVAIISTKRAPMETFINCELAGIPRCNCAVAMVGVLQQDRPDNSSIDDVLMGNVLSVGGLSRHGAVLGPGCETTAIALEMLE